MKHIFLMVGLLLTAGLFSACNEDFKDWAQPQSNAQQGAIAAVTAQLGNGTDKDIVKDQAGDMLNVAVYLGASDQALTDVVFEKLIVNGTYEVPFFSKEKNIYVTKAALDSVAQVAFNSKASVQRTLTMRMNAAAKDKVGQALVVQTNDIQVNYTPAATPAREANYYLLGDFNNWKYDQAVKMDDKGNGIYEATITVTADNCYWRIFGQKAVDEQDNDQSLGCATNGSTATEDFVVWNNPQTMLLEKTGKYVITFDAVNFRYTVKGLISELYMTGSHYNWGAAPSDWSKLVPVNGQSDEYWKIIYADAGEQIKFAPQAGWGNDFPGVVAGDNAASGVHVDGGNLKFGAAGWYLLYVNADTKAVEVFRPEVYLIGNTVGGWTGALPANRFTIPATRTGEFVSPALTAAGEVRIHVQPKSTIDWWKMEFIILGGKIEYRGTGGDQTRVSANAGERVYLNFSDNTGRIQ